MQAATLGHPAFHKFESSGCIRRLHFEADSARPLCEASASEWCPWIPPHCLGRFPARFAAIPREVLFGEPQPLPDGLPPVNAFDFDLLPDPVRPWAEDIVETMQAPAGFAGVTVMAGLGTVLGRKIGIRPQRNTCWTETANQWAMVIGRLGILKSPAIEACLAPVKALAAAAIADFKKEVHDHGIADKIAKMRAEAMEAQAKKAIRKDINAPVNGYFELGGDSADDDPQPVLHRYISNDPSPAALG